MPECLQSLCTPHVHSYWSNSRIYLLVTSREGLTDDDDDDPEFSKQSRVTALIRCAFLADRFLF